MKKTILYAVVAAVAVAVGAIGIVGCGGDYGESSKKMDDFLDHFHYNKRVLPKYTVTYDGNGADGIPPIDEILYDSNTVVYVKDKGTLTKGDLSFRHWNTMANGNGNTYSGDGTGWYTITKNDTLYAQWGVPTKRYAVTVTTTIATTGTSGSSNYAPGDIVRITAGTPPNNWMFQNWTSSVSSVSFTDATNDTTTFTMPDKNVTVIAVFVAASGGEVRAFTDSRDGKAYPYVKIGEQTWMARNMNYLNDMTISDSSWCYDNDPDNCNTYGRLYTWNVAVTACTAGWRLPDTADWNRLVTAIRGSSVAGTKLKATSGWDNNGNGTDDYGFSALPGGGYFVGGVGFSDIGNCGYWWTATEDDRDNIYGRIICSDGYDDDVRKFEYGRDGGGRFSVRCIKND